MTDTLQWAVEGVRFKDGSLLKDWTKVADSGSWDWQYDSHELTFEIYQHDGQYWKLYRARFVRDGDSHHSFGFGGQACRMALVRYRRRAKSPHSGKLMAEGAEEWVRSYEVDETLHSVVEAGREGAKYGAPRGLKSQIA